MPTPLKEIISEEDFLELFQKQTIDILKICTYLKEKGDKDYLYTKRFYGNITTQSRLLEDFLDDYGAKNNRTWIYFRELIATTRYMGFSAYMLKHIQNRFAFYEIRDEKKKNFSEQTTMMRDFFNVAIKAVFKCISDEAQRLGLAFP
ncbi:MAG: HPr family phosphocarrier protein, partial [Deltaproteobacteria bacterium]|nr:HPr family phosphocarrier protein [Deltaproteobacteria bacterium]